MGGVVRVLSFIVVWEVDDKRRSELRVWRCISGGVARSNFKTKFFSRFSRKIVLLWDGGREGSVKCGGRCDNCETTVRVLSSVEVDETTMSCDDGSTRI